MAGNEDLGRHLKTLRDGAGLTLREVQEQTDSAVKNSYLSQIEGGRIGRPSPNVLWHLAQVYGVDYNDLMQRAGHRVTDPDARTEHDLGGIPLSALKDLDEEERRTVLEYVEFIKAKRRRPSP